jgi:hypothetical protein
MGADFSEKELEGLKAPIEPFHDTTIHFPSWVKVTICTHRTYTRTVKTAHGIKVTRVRYHTYAYKMVNQ